MNWMKARVYNLSSEHDGKCNTRDWIAIDAAPKHAINGFACIAPEH